MKNKIHRREDFSMRRLKRRKWEDSRSISPPTADKDGLEMKTTGFDATSYDKQLITFFKNKHYGYYTHETILSPFSKQFF